MSALKRNGVSYRVVACLLAGTALAGMGAFGSAHAQSALTYNFSIPSKSLAAAISDLGAVTGWRIAYTFSLPASARSQPVSGALTPDQALTQLLSGSGYVYRITGPRSAVLVERVAAGFEAVQGEIQLEPIDVTAQGSGGGAAADLPYTTPGSTNYISEQDIQRFRGQTAGDMLKSTPGVVAASNTNGASLDVNIRGMQGQNRVVTKIDGSEQSTSSYRAYQGVDNRSYVDPDLIGGITISKGPEGGSAGAIGGTVSMETLNVDDILKPGETHGVRVKSSLASNGVEPVIGATTWRNGQPDDIGGGSMSAVLAATEENIDVLAAFVRRKSGNYFAGTEGDLLTENPTGGMRPLSQYKHGDEVLNTSEDSWSALFKTVIRPAEDHELKLSYLRHENDFGEIRPELVNWTGAGGFFRPIQEPLNQVSIDQMSARYTWDPSDNDLINLKVNSWASYTDEVMVYGVPAKSRNYGVEVANTSEFDLGDQSFALSYGGSFKQEDASSRYRESPRPNDIMGINGTRELGTLFVHGTWEPIDWLALDAGATYLTYHVENLTVPDISYRGLPYAPYDGDGVSPSAGVTITPLDGWQLFGKYTTGLRPPSLRESTYNASKLQFKPALVPEDARNWEIGTNYLASDVFTDEDKIRLKLAYFDNRTDAYIGREYVSRGGTLNNFNYDHVEIKGLELSGGYDAKPGFVDFAFNYYTDLEFCRTSTTCSDSTFQSDYLSNQIPPVFSAAVTAGARLLDDTLTIGGRITYVGERAASVQEDNFSVRNITKVWNPYTLVDLFAEWKVSDNITFDLSAENIFDRYYVDALANTDMPAPGRTVRASMTATLGSDKPFFPDLPFMHPFEDGAETWTGLYAGVHAGYGWGAVTGETTTAAGVSGGVPATESADMDMANLLGGVQGGVNYQLGNGLVFGLEGDFAWLKLNDFDEHLSTEGPQLIVRRQLQAKTEYEFSWLSTVRGRLGFGFDRAMLYGTAGAAFMKETERRTQFRSMQTGDATNPAGVETEPFFVESDENIRTGVALGAGVELAISKNWSLKGEYLYAGFGDALFKFGNARSGTGIGYRAQIDCRPNPRGGPCIPVLGNFPGSSATVDGREASNDAGLHTLKIGLNYRI